MPFPTVSYRKEGKTYGICGECGREGDFQFTTVCEQVGERYCFYCPGCFSSAHPCSHTCIQNNAETHTPTCCIATFARSFRTRQERRLLNFPVQHYVGLSLSHAAISTVLTSRKLSCFSQSLCRYHCIIAIALWQLFLPSPGSSPPAADVTHVTHDHEPCISYVALVCLGRSFTWKQKSEHTRMAVPLLSHVSAISRYMLLQQIYK